MENTGEETGADDGPRVPKKRGPGQRKKPTNRELAERIEFTVGMLVHRLYKHQIKRALKEKYGVNFRTAETYMSRAKSLMLSRTGRPKDEHVAEAYEFYARTIRNPSENVDLADKMRAQDSICRLLGLDAPTKIAPTTPDGKHPYQADDTIKSLTVDELVFLANIRQKALQNAKEASQGASGSGALPAPITIPECDIRPADAGEVVPGAGAPPGD